MIKLIEYLKWIIISLVLIAPFIELSRLLTNWCYQHPNFDLISHINYPEKLPDTSLKMIGISELFMAVNVLKYFLILYVIGLLVGLKFTKIFSDFEKEGCSLYCLTYTMVFIFLAFLILAALVQNSIILAGKFPLIFISIILIIISLKATKGQ